MHGSGQPSRAPPHAPTSSPRTNCSSSSCAWPPCRASATATRASSPAIRSTAATSIFYPLRLYAFPDGTYVVDEKGKDGLVGARLTAIGGMPYAEVAKRVRPLVPHDNASNLQGLLPHYLLTAEVLDGLGIAEAVGPLEFTFTQRGKSRSVTLSPITVPSYVSTFRDPIYGHYPSILPRRKPTPMYLRKSASLLWVGRSRPGTAPSSSASTRCSHRASRSSIA